jgi:hypothetical protein
MNEDNRLPAHCMDYNRFAEEQVSHPNPLMNTKRYVRKIGRFTLETRENTRFIRCQVSGWVVA